MPSSDKDYKDEVRFCLVCGKELVLKCKRDLKRKKHCSHACNAEASKKKIPVTDKVCSKCGKSFQSKVSTKTYCSQDCRTSDQVSRSYKMLNNNKEKYFQHALYKKGREQLTLGFILDLFEKQRGKCALSGQEMTFVKVPGRGRVPTNASIDQIVPGGGYTEDNVQLVCTVVNTMKLDMDISELRFWCRQILED